MLAKRPTNEQKKSHSTAVGEACTQSLPATPTAGKHKKTVWLKLPNCFFYKCSFVIIVL